MRVKAAVVSSKDWPVTIGLTWDNVDDLKAGIVPADLVAALVNLEGELFETPAEWIARRAREREAV